MRISDWSSDVCSSDLQSRFPVDWFGLASGFGDGRSTTHGVMAITSPAGPSLNCHSCRKPDAADWAWFMQRLKDRVASVPCGGDGMGRGLARHHARASDTWLFAGTNQHNGQAQHDKKVK